jgi:hypothetical protein
MNWSLLVWSIWIGVTLGSWLILELLGYWHVTPWTTLSEFIWSVEVYAGILKWVLFVGLAILAAHLATKWP